MQCSRRALATTVSSHAATVHPIDTSRAAVLSTYRSILRQINQQYTVRNDNRLWYFAAVSEYRQNKNASIEAAQGHQLNAQDFLAYLHSKQEHRRLMEEYWPASTLTPTEKIHRTANVVGLSMPRPLRDDETKQGGGKTRSEMLEEDRQTQ